LPECFSFIGNGPGEAQAQAESLDGPRVQQYKTLAQEVQVNQRWGWEVGGSTAATILLSLALQTSSNIHLVQHLMS